MRLHKLKVSEFAIRNYLTEPPVHPISLSPHPLISLGTLYKESIY